MRGYKAQKSHPGIPFSPYSLSIYLPSSRVRLRLFFSLSIYLYLFCSLNLSLPLSYTHTHTHTHTYTHTHIHRSIFLFQSLSPVTSISLSFFLSVSFYLFLSLCLFPPLSPSLSNTIMEKKLLHLSPQSKFSAWLYFIFLDVWAKIIFHT